jgi:hypothetical protein
LRDYSLFFCLKNCNQKVSILGVFVLKALSYPAATAVPQEHRRNFTHFYLDIGWFGILNSSSIAFAAIYATRQGASSLQIGWLNAAPALVALLFALPIGRWLVGKPVSRIVFWAALAHRLPYLFGYCCPGFFGRLRKLWPCSCSSSS